MMKIIQLFIDGSVNTKTKVGYGAMLLVKDKNTPIDELQSQVKIKRFEFTSSTKLEIENLLWALTGLGSIKCSICVYTDSQNILSLPVRRERFESHDYITKGGKTIKNHLLYKEFFHFCDLYQIELKKVKGHQISRQKTEIDHIFTIVDRASRNALRKEYSKKE